MLIKSNNNNSPCSVEIKLLDEITIDDNKWLNYQIELKMNDKSYQFKSQNKTATTALGTTAEIGKFAFAISPHNELETMQTQLKQFLASEHNSFRFEPYDPSFELIIERSELDNEFKVYFWVDAGNTTGLEYSWDGIGVRFVTNKKLLLGN
ncbi:MAG: hypothetical protein O3C63_07515 [Cyanobacteria bacterium]|nr:hypothetical protein [Cyanobacteriota bacterium]MDA1021475.1 hypothetical protein [Cyanobacteriota bacterium]